MKNTRAFRNNLLAAGLLIAAAISAQAQDRFGITATAGAGRVDISGLGVLDVLDPYIRSIPAYTAGIYYERSLHPQWSVRAGAQYASRGFTVAEDLTFGLLGLDLPVDARIDTRLAYVEVPVEVQWNLLPAGVTPFVRAGLTAGYAVDGKWQPRVNVLIPIRLPEIDIPLDSELINRFDLAGRVAGGVHIPVGDAAGIEFEVGYRHGLTDMFMDNISDIRIKSHTVTAGVSFAYRF